MRPLCLDLEIASAHIDFLLVSIACLLSDLNVVSVVARSLFA